MKTIEVNTIKPGVYRVFWNDGSSAVGSRLYPTQQCMWISQECFFTDPKQAEIARLEARIRELKGGQS